MTILKEFGIKNYKSIKDQQSCEFKKYTFLFGPNGSGKSTFLKSLLLLKNSLLRPNYTISETDEIEFRLFFSEKKDERVNSLGILFYQYDNYEGPNFDEINFESELYEKPKNVIVTLYYKNKSLNGWWIEDLNSGFSFKFEFLTDSKKNNVKINLGSFKKNVEDKIKDDDESLKFLVEFYEEEKQRLNELLSFVFQYTENIRCILHETGPDGFDNLVWDDILPRELEPNHKVEILEHYRDLASKYDLDEDIIFNKDNYFLNIRSLIGLGGDIISPYYNYLRKIILKNFQYVFHIGHIRSEFSRAFIKDDPKNSMEENILVDDLIKVWEFESTNKDSDLPNILKGLEFGDYLFIDNSALGVYQAFIAQNVSKINFSDMSSGFKQTIPLILKLKLYHNSTILVEQPELHLHPKLQSELIHVLVKNNKQNRFIIETHSEHMIRKVQIMIATGELDKDDVAVYYFDNKSGSTKIKEMKMDDRGLFYEDWPNGFFDESTDLTLELYEALRKSKNPAN